MYPLPHKCDLRSTSLGRDTTEQLPFHFSLSCIGEGNGNLLQCSFLENPRDGGAWWAAVYGTAQSGTRLKWLRSSSSSRELYAVLVPCQVWKLDLRGKATWLGHKPVSSGASMGCVCRSLCGYWVLQLGVGVSQELVGAVTCLRSRLMGVSLALVCAWNWSLRWIQVLTSLFFSHLEVSLSILRCLDLRYVWQQ